MEIGGRGGDKETLKTTRKHSLTSGVLSTRADTCRTERTYVVYTYIHLYTIYLYNIIICTYYYGAQLR